MKFLLTESKLDKFIENQIRELNLEFFCDVEVSSDDYNIIQLTIKVNKHKLQKNYNFNSASITMELDYIKKRIIQRLQPFKGIEFQMLVVMGTCE